MSDRFFAVPLAVRCGLTVWLVLAVGVSVRVVLHPADRATVVPIYLRAGGVWRAGGDLYAPTGLDVYRYPPGFAALFAPLSHLPEKSVAVGWRLLGAGVLVAGLHRFGHATGLGGNARGWLLGGAAVLSTPSVNNGQVNTLLAGAAVFGTVEALRGRWWRAAGWLGLGGWVKVYPLSVGLLLGVARPRLAGPLLLVAAGGFVLPFALADRGYVADQYRRFAESTLGDDRTHDRPVRVPRDWTVLPRTWLGRTVPVGDANSLSLVVAVGLAGLVYARRSAELALVLGCGWTAAFGPATEGNTYAVLAGPAAWVCVAAGPIWARAVGRVGCGLLLLAVARGVRPGVAEFELLGVQPVGAVLVMLAGWGLCRRGTLGA